MSEPNYSRTGRYERKPYHFLVSSCSLFATDTS